MFLEKKIFLLFLIFLLLPLYPQEYVNHTLKQQNLKFRFPFGWRWNSFHPSQHENKVFEAFGPAKKIIFQIYAEPTKSPYIQKVFYKHQKKWGLSFRSEPEFVSAEFPNLQNLGAYMALVSSQIGSINYLGYYVVGSDGLFLYYFRLDSEAEEFFSQEPILLNILLSIETIFDWNHICCALCLKEIRYSTRKSTVCTDFIVENPCYQYLKNTKMDYEKCR